jgi:hypothetical protein
LPFPQRPENRKYHVVITEIKNIKDILKIKHTGIIFYEAVYDLFLFIYKN